jgi:hypothetical protein
LSGIVLTNSNRGARPELFDLIIYGVVRFFRLFIPVFAATVFGWLASCPNHRGLRLGEIVANKVTERLSEHGLKCNFLGTQDFRLAAIKLYLRTGWVSIEQSDQDKERWQAVYGLLGRLR